MVEETRDCDEARPTLELNPSASRGEGSHQDSQPTQTDPDVAPPELDEVAAELQHRRILANMFSLDMPDPQLGHYRLLHELGRGAMGIVYAAHDSKLDRVVAIKRLQASNSATLRQRLLREAQAMARLSHPNVVAVYEICEVDDSTFIVMEKVEGETLARWLASKRHALGERLDALASAGEGLAAAHAKGMVHRDFKPENVMVDASGRVRVMDFGLAYQNRYQEDTIEIGDDTVGRPLKLTRTGTILGTPAYMAPEQLRGEWADATSDQFAFCVVLYEALYGHRPFVAASLDGLLAQIEGEQIRAEPEASRVPAWLRTIVVRGLKPHPQDRYDSMRALLDTLAHARRLNEQATPDPVLARSRHGSEANPLTHLEAPDAIARPDSPFYVLRSDLEERCKRELNEPGALLRIKGPQRVGKTSLMTRILDETRAAGMRTVRVDLQLLERDIVSSLKSFLQWFCAIICRRLRLPVVLDSWDDVFGAKDNCTAIFEDHFLVEEDPLVLAINHLDHLFDSAGVATDFLTLLRAWHEMGKSEAPWGRLRLLLIYSTEMYVPMSINHSPLNVGTAIVLGDWDAATIEDLARRHGLGFGAREVEALMGLIGGHPYLVRLALHHMATTGGGLDELLDQATNEQGLFANHVKKLLWTLQEQPELQRAAIAVLGASEPVELDPEPSFKLVSLGVARPEGEGLAPGRELYRRYLLKHLSGAT